jgi:hypothetical protein
MPTFMATMLTPAHAAAVSSSRIDFAARPIRDLSSQAKTAGEHEDGDEDLRSLRHHRNPRKPSGPPGPSTSPPTGICSVKLLKKTRTTSENATVAIAR